MKPGSAIPADWLNQVRRWMLRNVSINGAKFQQQGGSLAIDISDVRKGGGVSRVRMAKIDAVTGTGHNATYDVTSLDGSVALTGATPYIRPIDSGGDLVPAVVDDWAMLALVEDASGSPDWILWQVPEVIETAQCSSGAGPQTITTDTSVAAQTTMVLIDSTAGIVTATLPAAADNENREITVIWVAGTNAAKVASAGGTLRGIAGPITIGTLYDGLTFKAGDDDKWWEV